MSQMCMKAYSKLDVHNSLSELCMLNDMPEKTHQGMIPSDFERGIIPDEKAQPGQHLAGLGLGLA